MNKFIYMIALVGVVASLNACDSRQEDQRKASLENKADNLENRADQVRDAGELKADATEARDPGLNSAGTQAAAAAARDSSEHKADALENQADVVRDQKD